MPEATSFDAPMNQDGREGLYVQLIGWLLFRLGGEQTFGAHEIDEIQKTVGGVRVAVVTKADKTEVILARVLLKEGI